MFMLSGFGGCGFTTGPSAIGDQLYFGADCFGYFIGKVRD